MGQPKFEAVTVLKEMQCGTCGVWHALPQALFDKCYEEGGFWHCPNGHSRGYSEGTLHAQNKKLKAELEEQRKATEAEKKRKEWALQEAKNADERTAAEKRKTAKLKKRIGNGVCPCCQRSFTNLQRHMHTQHPDYTAKESA